MEDNFRARLAQELDDQPEPPLGDLVTGALRQGRRIRRVRRAKVVVSTLAVVGVLTTGAVLGGHALIGHRDLPAASLTAHPTLVIVPTTAATPPEATAPATAATVVYRLKQLVGPAQTSGYARSTTGSPAGQINVNRGHGTGMLRLSIASSADYQPCQPSNAPDLTVQCSTLSDGAGLSIIRIPDNCIQSLVVDVVHGNGVAVELEVSTCLAWNGHENPPGVEALTTDEAIKIADDPSWGTRMDAALVTAAQAEFPHLPTFS